MAYQGDIKVISRSDQGHVKGISRTKQKKNTQEGREESAERGEGNHHYFP
jgi:hypothetical protein